jgi:MFS family permease
MHGLRLLFDLSFPPRPLPLAWIPRVSLPSKIKPPPPFRTLAFTLSGIGCLGFSVAFLFVPLLPEIIAAVAEKENLENSPFLSDKASGIYNSAYGIGNCLAPIIGGAITGSQTNKIIGFQLCCDIMAVSSLSFCGIYLLFAILPACLDEKKKNNRRENKLIEDLQPTDDKNNLTIEFEYNRNQIGVLNDSNRK